MKYIIFKYTRNIPELFLTQKFEFIQVIYVKYYWADIWN